MARSGTEDAAEGGGCCIVCADRDKTLGAALAKHLAATGGEGLQSPKLRMVAAGVDRRFGDQDPDPAVVKASVVFVLLSPWLVATDYCFESELLGLVELHEAGRTRVVPVLARALDVTGNPLATRIAVQGPTLDALKEEEAWSVAAHALAAAAEATPVPAPPPTGPVYEDAQTHRLGERLVALCGLRSLSRSKAIEPAIAATRAEQRRVPRLRPGELLEDERYRLLEHLGDGAIASTWRAADKTTGRSVAVKVLHGRWLKQRDVIKAFDGAAETTGGLDHSGVPDVVQGRGAYEGFVFHVNEYLSGGDLEQALAAGLGWEDALQALLEVGEVLGHAHGKRVFHGDVNPRDILFDADGAARLTDFGLAHAARVAGHHAMGSLFAAPESLEADARPTARADAYGLAMTALYAWYRKPLPFWVLRKVDDFIGVVEAPEHIKQALLRGLSFEPKERFESVAELCAAMLADDEVRFALAEAAGRRGRHEVAIGHYQRLLQANKSSRARVGLAHAMAASGRLVEAVEGLLDTIDDGVGSEAAEDLRAEAAALVDQLETRALSSEDPYQQLAAVARLRDARLNDPARAAAVWTLALQHHTARLEAEEALIALCSLDERAEDWMSFVANGRDLLNYVGAEDRPQIQYRIGRVLLDELGDRSRGRHWLATSAEAGYKAAGLAETLERLCMEAGDWAGAVVWIRKQAAAASGTDGVAALLRAALLALRALDDRDLAVSLYEEVLELNPSHPTALRFLARRAHGERQTARALELYGALLPDPGTGGSVAQRIPDEIGYAQVLLASDRQDDALKRIQLVLGVKPDHIPALRLAAELLFEQGRWDEARDAHLRIVGNFSAVGGGAELHASLLALGEIAWLHEHVDETGRWFDEALDLDPKSVAAWWGKSRSALLARTSGSKAEPWRTALRTPFTPQEGLARLFAGLLERASMLNWLEQDPLGWSLRARVEDGAPLRVAAAVVGLMERRQLIGPALFDRLKGARASWARQIKAVRGLWCARATDVPFPVAESMGWSEPPLLRPRERIVLGLDVPIRKDAPPWERPSLNILRGGIAWHALLHTAGEVLDPVVEDHGALEDPTDQTSERRPDLKAAFVAHHGRPKQKIYDVDRDVFALGSSGEAGAAGCTLYRCGHRYYIDDHGDGKLSVDGVPVQEVRLKGGELVELAGTPFRFLLYDSETPPELVVQVALDPVGEEVEVEELDEAALEDLTPQDTDPGGDVAPRRTVLIVDSGPRAGRVIPIDARDEFTIGRARKSDLTLKNDSNVSREHCKIVCSEGKWAVLDNGSSNGTLVNGEAYKEVVLNDGDRIGIGDYRFVFRTAHDGVVDPYLETPNLAPNLSETPSLPVRRLSKGPVGEETGKIKVKAANDALAVVTRAFDSAAGHGRGVAELQLMVQGAPRRFAAVFEDVQVTDEGLPDHVILDNITKRPAPEQHHVLNAALSDLVDRAVSMACDTLPDGLVDEVLEQVSQVNYRELLRL